MTNSQRLATVRARLLQWLAQQSQNAAAPTAIETDSPVPEPNSQVSDADSQVSDTVSQVSEADREMPTIVRESILIRDDFYCGRRFYMPEHQAVWFIEEDELKIYLQNGDLACVLRGEEIDAVAEETPHVIQMPRRDDSDGEIRRAA